MELINKIITTKDPNLLIPLFQEISFLKPFIYHW